MMGELGPVPTAGELRLLVERIERLIEERKGITEDIRDVYAEAKARGFDTRAIRQMVQRRAMQPDIRAEADAVLETYENAIGYADDEALPDLRPDAAALAVELLGRQIEGIEDAERVALLVDHVLFLLDLRAEIAELRRQETARKALVKAEGFEAKQVSVTVRWFEKCAKHGEEAMRSGEAVFHLYRGTVEAAPPREAGPVSDDATLARMFAPPPPAKPSKAGRTLARMRFEAEAARRALND